jgi:hypothetical protein
MEKIDWNHWFRYRTLKDWEAVALSLGINPMDIDVNSIGGINYILDEIIPKHKVECESRMRLLQDFRDKPYSYFEGDDEAGNYFDASDSKFKKVLVKRFFLWLKNEDMGWTLPKELQACIEKLNNNPKALEVVVNSPKVIEGEITQLPVSAKVIQKWKLKPGKVYPGYRLPLFEFLKKEYDDGRECPPNAYDFIAKLNEGIANGIEPENIWVKRYGIEYKIKSGKTKEADLKTINQAIKDLIIKLPEDE